MTEGHDEARHVATRVDGSTRGIMSFLSRFGWHRKSKVAGASQMPSKDKTHELVRQKRYGMAPFRVPAKEDIMRAGSFVTLFSVMVILFLAMVPALAQTTQASPTGGDWVWIIGTVALIAAAIWYFMRSGRRA